MIILFRLPRDLEQALVNLPRRVKELMDATKDLTAAIRSGEGKALEELTEEIGKLSKSTDELDSAVKAASPPHPTS